MCVVLFLVQVGWKAAHPTIDPPRAQVEHLLEKQPGRHLAIVRYAAGHDIFNEWVYNAADIDTSRVVWARDMSAADNREIIDYYKDRQVWLVEPDHTSPRVSPYQPESAHSLPSQSGSLQARY